MNGESESIDGVCFVQFDVKEILTLKPVRQSDMLSIANHHAEWLKYFFLLSSLHSLFRVGEEVVNSFHSSRFDLDPLRPVSFYLNFEGDGY